MVRAAARRGFACSASRETVTTGNGASGDSDNCHPPRAYFYKPHIGTVNPLSIASTAKRIVKRALATVRVDVRRIPKIPFGWLRNLDIKTVLDVGANTGQFATLIREILPQCDIYSFEPLGDCFEKLRSLQGRLGRFHAIKCALGEEDTEVDMHRSEFSPSSSVLAMRGLHARLFPHTARTWVERVQMRKLDDVAAELEIRDNLLIKIDVQGYEDRVIRGGTQVVTRAKVLIVEVSFQPLYESQPLFDSIYQMLDERGFKYAGSMDQLTSPVDGSIVQCDAIFLKADL